MLSEKLKDQTKTNHQLLEKKLIVKLKGINHKADYIKLLQLFGSYFSGLDHLISLHLNKLSLPDYGKRRKANLIAADLISLGAKPFTPAEDRLLPQILNHAQSLGALYVIEGSTLGGQIISQLLVRQLGDISAISFFSGYGADTMAMWQKFKAVLDLAENEPGDEIIATANETFLKFSQWLDAND
jgi:heme oxygenase